MTPEGCDSDAMEILAAWQQHGDCSGRDSLWRAACWVTAGIESSTSGGRTRAFGEAAHIVNGDPDAGFAVAELLRARLFESPRASLRPRPTSWGQAKRGAWR